MPLCRKSGKGEGRRDEAPGGSQSERKDGGESCARSRVAALRASAAGLAEQSEKSKPPRQPLFPAQPRRRPHVTQFPDAHCTRIQFLKQFPATVSSVISALQVPFVSRGGNTRHFISFDATLCNSPTLRNVVHASLPPMPFF